MKRLLANCLVLLLTSGLATGQRPRGSPKRLAVDVVSVKGGPQLFGAVLSRSADGGLTMAVERAWLEKTYPRYYQELAAGERALATAAREGLTRRIERWQRRRSEDANLVLFLREQAQQVAKPLDAAAATTSQFVMIELAAGEVRNVFRQPPRQRRIAELAWALRLDNVTTRTANHLQRELQKREVDVAKAPQLADRFGTLPQGEQEWAARMALVEFRLRKKLTFQGEGEYVARTGSGADKSCIGGHSSSFFQRSSGPKWNLFHFSSSGLRPRLQSSAGFSADGTYLHSKMSVNSWILDRRL